MADASLVTVSCGNHHQILFKGLRNQFLVKQKADCDMQYSGRTIRVHRLLLDVFMSSDSQQLQAATFLSPATHPADDPNRNSLDLLVEFLYQGRVNVRQDQLPELLDAAKDCKFHMLEIAVETAIKREENKRRGPPSDQMTTREALRKATPQAQSARGRRDSLIVVADAIETDQQSGLEKAKGQELEEESDRSQDEASGIHRHSITTLCQVSLRETDDIVAPKRGRPCRAVTTDSSGSFLNGDNDDSTAIAEPAGKGRPPKKKEKRRFDCFCGKFFSKADDLRRHSYSHSTEEFKYKCGECDAAFRVMRELSEHKSTHSYTCTVCQTVFGRAQNLRDHMQTHREKKGHQCSFCDKTYKRSSSLIAHNAQEHGGLKPFQCPLCDMRFSQRVNMLSHSKTHAGLKEFKCDQCEKAFQSRFNLKNHQRSHTNDYRFTCETCGKSFFDARYKERHALTHLGIKPFACSLCPKKFSGRNGLNLHQLTHSKVRPHQCDICGRAFVLREHLRRHIETHSEKNQQCSHCGKAYASVSSLKAHERKCANQ